jgi:nudix-type nucleoside diphosphatase (YffH/AdpP family)
MTRKVEILELKEVFRKAIFVMMQARLRHEKFDGSMSPEITRLSLERGDAVAAIMYNPLNDTILLIELFRYPSYAKTQDGWLTEIPAGMIENSEAPADAMRREIEEETGYRVDKLQEIFEFFPSPGGSSERIFIYFSRINPAQHVGAGGGMAKENEDIRTIYVTVDDALKLLDGQKIKDGKTIIALQWLAANRSRLKDL